MLAVRFTVKFQTDAVNFQTSFLIAPVSDNAIVGPLMEFAEDTAILLSFCFVWKSCEKWLRFNKRESYEGKFREIAMAFYRRSVTDMLKEI